MKSNILATLVACLFVVMAPSLSAQTGSREINRGTITLQLNEERILDIPVSRVIVANTSVASAREISNGQQVLVTAIGPGTTDLRLSPVDDPSTTLRFQVTVRRSDLDAVRREVDALLAYMVGVQVERAGEHLVLKGEVLEPVDRTRLDRVVELYPELIDFTVNRYSQVEEDRLRELILNDLEQEGLTTIRVEIKNVRSEFKAMLRGVAFTDRAKNRAEQIARLYYEDVINLIHLEKPVIEVDVVLTTLDLNKIKQLGTNNAFAQLTTVTGTGYLNSNFGRDSFFKNNADGRGQVPGARRPDEPGVSSAPVLNFAPTINLQNPLRALKQSDAAVFYSEQHQAVLSGETAEFNDGGTLLFRTTTGDVSEVTEVQFGLQVNVTPEQKEDGTIVNTIEVSNSTPVALSAATEGADVALANFRTASVVECRSEETIVLSGADITNTVHSDAGTPFLRRVPVVNLLFRARDKQGGERRSLIFITPTSSTIFREERASFSTAARRKVSFFREESIYWERDLDWGYYNEFYVKPGNTVPYINTYTRTLWYDDATQSAATVGGMSYDVPALTDTQSGGAVEQF